MALSEDPKHQRKLNSFNDSGAFCKVLLGCKFTFAVSVPVKMTSVTLFLGASPSAFVFGSLLAAQRCAL